MAQNRIKEIGVRKVLGASVLGVTSMLSKDFLKLVAIAFLFATPIAWYGMEHWLQTYAYRVNISVWVFAIAAFVTTLLSISNGKFPGGESRAGKPGEELEKRINPFLGY
jgi:putative ABC transport system permease protein